MAESWDSDRFEDRVTRAVVALYESAIDPQDIGGHWSQVSGTEMLRIRRQGVFIPAPDRIIWEQGIDGVDGVPTSGCMSLGECRPPVGAPDIIESYCRIQAFRKVPRIPRQLSFRNYGTAYELLTVFPQDSGPVRAAKTWHSVGRSGAVTMAFPCGVPAYDAGSSERTLGAALQYVADARHTWTITAHTDESRVSLGAYPDDIQSLLYARSLPLTASGRKRPIVHLVAAHRRRLREGVEIDVREFLRGSRVVEMDGVRFSVAPPAAVVERLAGQGDRDRCASLRSAHPTG